MFSMDDLRGNQRSSTRNHMPEFTRRNQTPPKILSQKAGGNLLSFIHLTENILKISISYIVGGIKLFLILWAVQDTAFIHFISILTP